jgi:hypothetical protein
VKRFWYGKFMQTERMNELNIKPRMIWIGPITEKEFEELQEEDFNICEFRHNMKEEKTNEHKKT